MENNVAQLILDRIELLRVDMATKDDISAIRKDMATKDDISLVRKEISNMEYNIREDMDLMESRIRKDVNNLEKANSKDHIKIMVKTEEMCSFVMDEVKKYDFELESKLKNI